MFIIIVMKTIFFFFFENRHAVSGFVDESSKEQHLFEIDIFCNVFAVIIDQLNKSILVLIVLPPNL